MLVWVTWSVVTHVVVPTVTDGGQRVGAGLALEVHVVAGADLSRVQQSVAEPQLHDRRIFENGTGWKDMEKMKKNINK